jgi:hypothetical protein
MDTFGNRRAIRKSNSDFSVQVVETKQKQKSCPACRLKVEEAGDGTR